METFRRAVLLFCLIPLLAGCSSTLDQRKAFFSELSPERISESSWRNYTGMYRGTIHSTAMPGDIMGVNVAQWDVQTEGAALPGVTVAEIRFELSGTPDDPLVYLEMDCASSSTWTLSETYLEKYTNIAQRQYGVKGRVLAYSHAPNQLLISLQPAFFSPNRGAAMILTFRGKGCVDIEYIGHFSRRGNGNLTRVQTFPYYSR
ncbi:MAG: hypothetical protein WCH43_12930 [Verrucomicrobiota bacterium]